MLLKAEHYYLLHNINYSTDIINIIRNKDHYNMKMILLYIGILVYSEKKVELYKVCEELININCPSYIIYYAVGCYYYLIKDNIKCREYFYKCLAKNNDFIYCWISLGLLYSSEDESDQSINTFINTNKKYPGNIYTIIYLSMEQMKTNNLLLAEQYLLNIKDENINNGLLWNELGVIYYRNGRYDDSLICFLNVIKIIGKLPQV